MSYNHGREERKWRLWKDAEERTLRELGVDDAISFTDGQGKHHDLEVAKGLAIAAKKYFWRRLPKPSDS